jgi:acetoin utilization protein AcuC
MKGKLVYPYSDALLQYEFKKEHPLKPDRLKLTHLLSEQLGLMDMVQLVEPKVAKRADLEMFHTPDFIDAVVECGDSDSINARYGLGIADNPTFPRIGDCKGSIQCFLHFRRTSSCSSK